jgi:hypothetical protein
MATAAPDHRARSRAGGVEGQQAGAQDGHPVPQALRLLQVVGAEEDGAPLAFQALQELPNLPGGLGVQAGGGFIEEEDGRIREQGAGEGQTLAHPL